MKTQDAYALRGFDTEKFLQKRLTENGLGENGLEKISADLSDAADMQRARKAYQRLEDELKTFRKKIIRHIDRLREYQSALTKDLARLDDDDYYFSRIKPHSKRSVELSGKYAVIAQKLNAAEDKLSGIIYNLDQYQRKYYTKIFAERLKEARKKAGLTQAELAEKIGVKRSSFNAFETCRNEPNISIVALVSQELNRPISWFLEK